MANAFSANKKHNITLSFDLNNPQHAAVVEMINDHITSLIADALAAYFADSKKRASLPSSVQKDLLNLFNSNPELINHITAEISGVSSSADNDQIRFNNFDSPSKSPSRAPFVAPTPVPDQVVFKSVKVIETYKKDFDTAPPAENDANGSSQSEPDGAPHLATLQSGLSIFGVK